MFVYCFWCSRTYCIAPTDGLSILIVADCHCYWKKRTCGSSSSDPVTVFQEGEILWKKTKLYFGDHVLCRYGYGWGYHQWLRPVGSYLDGNRPTGYRGKHLKTFRNRPVNYARSSSPHIAKIRTGEYIPVLMPLVASILGYSRYVSIGIWRFVQLLVSCLFQLLLCQQLGYSGLKFHAGKSYSRDRGCSLLLYYIEFCCKEEACGTLDRHWGQR